MMESGMWVGEETHKKQIEQARNDIAMEPHISIRMDIAPTTKQVADLREVFMNRPGKTTVYFSVLAGGGRKKIKTEYSVALTNATMDAIAKIVGRDKLEVVNVTKMV
jgi:hypothetical protein